MKNVPDMNSIEMEAAARVELTKFHIDSARYSLRRVERLEGGTTQLTFDGESDDNIFPQVLVLFEKLPGGWEIRTDLTLDAKVREPGLTFIP